MKNYMPFETLMGGKLNAQYMQAMEDIANNIMDPNRDADATREITIKIKIKPTVNGDQVAILGQVIPKLAPEKAVATFAFVDKDIDGQIDMCEYGGHANKQVQGQTQVTQDGITVDTHTGEIIEADAPPSNLKHFKVVGEQ